jgi:hypothetical protein
VSRPVADEAAAVPSGSDRPSPDDVSPDAAGRPWLSWAMVAVGGLVFVAWISIAVAHVDDRFGLDQVSGARIALARYFNDGTLYPALYDGHSYGGTRFMPLPIVLHGLIARLTDDYVVSGKVLGYATTLGLLVTMFALLRRLRCPVPYALILTALVLTTFTGLHATMDMRADVLPLLLQLLAVGIVSSTDRPAGTVAAAALAALAFISKLSAVWAPLAIIVWLFARDRRRLAWFSVPYVVLAGGSLLLFAAITEGRIFENVFGLAATGITGLRSIVQSPYRFAHLMVENATTAWAIVPFAVFAGWLALKERRATIYHLSLLFALAVVLVVLTDVGTGWNQLIDIVVLSALVIGGLVARDPADRGSLDRAAAGTVALMLSLALLWVTLSGFAVTLVPEVQDAIDGEPSYRADPFSGVADPRTTILSEDPYVPISLGQTPVVLDAFMLLRLGKEQPGAILDLIGRIEAQEFDLVVLVVPLEPLDQPWWNELNFGPDVVRAISEAYVFAGRTQGYYVYEPRRASAEA